MPFSLFCLLVLLSRLPPLPRSMEGLNFDGEWSKTLNGEEFMLGSRDGTFMCTTKMTNALVAELYLDETFEVCPRLFYQVFTLHAFNMGSNLRWYASCYQARVEKPITPVFILLKEAAENLHLDIDPQKVLIDFELTLQQSVTICFPQAETKGCLFHNAQAVCMEEGTESWTTAALQRRRRIQVLHPVCHSIGFRSTFLRVGGLGWVEGGSSSF